MLKLIKNDIIFDNYIFIKKIGDGANGIVIKTRDKKNNKLYAIKIQNTIGLFGNGYISRLEIIINEINVLKHVPKNKYFPSFIKDYFDNIKNNIYIVTELVINYITLDIYTKKYKYNENDMFNISRQLCESINLLHKSNICHGDFFPKNILICPQTLNIKIIDFGAGYYLNDKLFISYYNKKENEKINTKTAIKKVKINDLTCLGLTIYTLLSYGRDFNRDWMTTQKDCGINILFQNKNIFNILINSFNLSDNFYKLAIKKYKYYKSLSTLLYPYHEYINNSI